ncbi:MAG: radical SAM/SPASM domain-containing protein [Muribaculaceae bacterium]
MKNQYYRPVWTCGRYDEKTKTALYYNLIEGLVHYFIDESAQVIGIILRAGRNNAFLVEDIVKVTGLDSSCVSDFLEMLANNNLITEQIPTKESIKHYRELLSKLKIDNSTSKNETIHEKLPFETSNAEMSYSERVGGVLGVMFEMTYRCSEKCVHCYNPGATRNDSEESHRGDREEMTFDDYKRIIDDLYDNGLVKVCLSGGDPFSNSCTWEVIDYLYQKDIAFDVFTNGQSIVNDVKRLADYFPRLVGISIYSGNAEEHDKITRIKGSWEKSISVVSQLSELSVPMNIKCCVMRPNLPHYYEVDDIARKYGAKSQFEVSLSDSVEGDRCVSKFLRLSEEQMEVVLRDSNVPLYVGKEAPNYGSIPREPQARLCGAGESGFCVTPEGNLIPCCSFHLVFGNIKETPFSKIIENSQSRRNWLECTYSMTTDCGKYDYCEYCNLCAGNNYSEHGNYLMPASTNCWLAKVRHNLANKMKQGYDPLCGMSLPEAISKLETQENKNISRTFVSDDEN